MTKEVHYRMLLYILEITLLLPFQAFGIALDTVKTLAFETGSDVTTQLDFAPGK
ncbi:hypothetical protein AB2G84_23865 (plasmid) [Escherichia coli]